VAFDLLSRSHSFSPRTHGFRSTTIPAVMNDNNNNKLPLLLLCVSHHTSLTWLWTKKIIDKMMAGSRSCSLMQSYRLLLVMIFVCAAAAAVARKSWQQTGSLRLRKSMSSDSTSLETCSTLDLESPPLDLRFGTHRTGCRDNVARRSLSVRPSKLSRTVEMS
jgi:hypothetical protein